MVMLILARLHPAWPAHNSPTSICAEVGNDRRVHLQLWWWRNESDSEWRNESDSDGEAETSWRWRRNGSGHTSPQWP